MASQKRVSKNIADSTIMTSSTAKRMPWVSGMSVQAPDETEKCISTPIKASAMRMVMMPQFSLANRSNTVLGLEASAIVMRGCPIQVRPNAPRAGATDRAATLGA